VCVCVYETKWKKGRGNWTPEVRQMIHNGFENEFDFYRVCAFVCVCMCACVNECGCITHAHKHKYTHGTHTVG
jgi:hypothetical protein